MAAIELHGMTWDHSRGYPCMVAVSQRYEELHPHVKIHWEKRSLADFENQPVGSWQNGMICWLSTIHGLDLEQPPACFIR